MVELLTNDYEFCVDKFGLDDKIVDQLKNGYYGNVDENAKCFTKCFFERAGFMDSEAKLNEDFIIEKVSAVLPREKILNLLLKCDEDIGENACDTAFRFYQCFRE